MKIGSIKNEKPCPTKVDKYLKIQTYGEQNRFPQDLLWISNASSTGASCIDVYSRFLKGKGFSDASFFSAVLDRSRTTADQLLGLLANDYARFGGFYMHINYDANYKIREIQWVPFETVRLGELDDLGRCNNVAIHWDWTRDYQALKKWEKADISYISLYNPDKEVIAKQVADAGGWDKYKGQVYIYYANSALNYPLPIYFAAITDMSTEQGIATISYRNARNNFLPSGMLCEIMNTEEGEAQASDNEKSIMSFQGDEEACKIMYSSVNSKEEIPVFVKFPSQNYDKEFTVTDESARGRIGRAFNQPPVLRAEDVGSNFGADMLENAYNYYNAVTEVDRLMFERVFKELFSHWHGPVYTDFSIVSLSYTAKNTLFEKLGENGITQLVSILENPAFTIQVKHNMITLLFGLSGEEVNKLLNTIAV